ncbi:MAG: hypothetical protein D3917_15010 [Candidatus Electrothrix sp. AX5]|nr:hypothetical protein [Candidatus Electrothrix sp. AX5]
MNYRKQISPSFNDLYPEDQFQLYGITSRYPKKLFSRQAELTKVQDGASDIHRGSDDIRLIVLNEIPHAKHNAIWHFDLIFSKKKQLPFEKNCALHLR